jgi:hypothetical protein
LRTAPVKSEKSKKEIVPPVKVVAKPAKASPAKKESKVKEVVKAAPAKAQAAKKEVKLVGAKRTSSRNEEKQAAKKQKK